MNDLKILEGMFNVLVLVAGNLLFKDHYCIFPTVNSLQTMLSCSKRKSQMMKSWTTGRKRRRRKKKRIWQLTHYLCRYPWVTSTPTSTPFLFPTLSICQRRYKIPLSWRLSRDYPSVPQEVGRRAEMLHYRWSKGYSKFNGPQVVHKVRGTKEKSNHICRHPLLTSLFLLLVHSFLPLYALW